MHLSVRGWDDSPGNPRSALQPGGEGARGVAQSLAQTPPELAAPPCGPQLAVPEARPTVPPSGRPSVRLPPPRSPPVPSAAVHPAMAARLLLRSLRVLSARSAPRPLPSAR